MKKLWVCKEGGYRVKARSVKTRVGTAIRYYNSPIDIKAKMFLTSFDENRLCSFKNTKL